MANSQEDFTFPTTTAADSPPRFLDSPPLWRREKSKGKEVEDKERFNLPLFQEFRGSSRERNCTSGDECEEEKMDMLWEDLNENQFSRGRKTLRDSDTSSPSRELKISCVKAFKLSRANGQMVSGKKTSILVFIKALKKVFLMHKSQHAIKNTS